MLAVSTPYRSPSRTRRIRGAVVSLALGVVVGLVMSAEGDWHRVIVTVTLCSVNGFSIWTASVLLFGLAGHRIGSMPRGAAIAARCGLFVASAVVAWLVMAMVAQAMGIDLGPRAPIYLAITCGMAVTAGFVFYSFDVVRNRLEASVARLKEVEFAEKELGLARELQHRLLPPPEVSGDGFRIAARNLAARLVAGDFYDTFRLPDGNVGVAVGDVAGKGMAAALIMASVKAMLPLIAAERSAADTLRELNRRLATELPGREFVALAFARFDPPSGKVELANAGLPDPYLLAAGSDGKPPVPLVVPGPRLPLGVRHEVDYRSLSVRLAPGDRLLLLSDGLPEASAGAGEPLGYPALANLVAAGSDGDAPLAWIDRLLDRVRAATQPGLDDDWTALLVERSPEPAARSADPAPPGLTAPAPPGTGGTAEPGRPGDK